MQCHELYIRHQLWKVFNGLHHIIQFLQAVHMHNHLRPSCH